jgi:hypothetical protein
MKDQIKELEDKRILSQKLTTEDFHKAREALRKANVPSPYKAIYNLEES